MIHSMYARRQIIEENSYAHLVFRCLNRDFLFKAEEIKQFIILTWFRYFQRYNIKIFAFIVMDNHAHMVIQTPGPEEIGHFMRTTNFTGFQGTAPTVTNNGVNQTAGQNTVQLPVPA